MTDGSPIGASPRRKEDAPLLEGRGRYLDDLRRPGTVHLGVVRSPHAHARIRRIAADQARALPGVGGLHRRRPARGRARHPRALRRDAQHTPLRPERPGVGRGAVRRRAGGGRRRGRRLSAGRRPRRDRGRLRPAPAGDDARVRCARDRARSRRLARQRRRRRARRHRRRRAGLPDRRPDRRGRAPPSADHGRADRASRRPRLPGPRVRPAGRLVVHPESLPRARRRVRGPRDRGREGAGPRPRRGRRLRPEGRRLSRGAPRAGRRPPPRAAREVGRGAARALRRHGPRPRAGPPGADRVPARTGRSWPSTTSFLADVGAYPIARRPGSP